MSEIDFIKNLAKGQFKDKKLIKGIGDDAAVIDRGDKYELVSTDMFVEGDHFRLDWFSPEQIANKCIEASVSDIYAMGGLPKYIFLSLSVSEKISDDFLDKFSGAIKGSCRIHNSILAGGDTTHGDLFVIDVCVIGEVEKDKLCLRSGAKPGDLIAVTGPLGGSWAGLELFRKFGAEIHSRTKDGAELHSASKCFGAGCNPAPSISAHNQNHPKIIKKYLEPKSQPKKSQILNKYVSAMIDVSDGIGAEVRHICDAMSFRPNPPGRVSGEISSLGAKIYKEKIPLFNGVVEVAASLNKDPYSFAISGGEDFELLFTISPESLKKLQSEEFKENEDFYLIGELRKGKEIKLIFEGKDEELPFGYDHMKIK